MFAELIQIPDLKPFFLFNDKKYFNLLEEEDLCIFAVKSDVSSVINRNDYLEFKLGQDKKDIDKVFMGLVDSITILDFIRIDGHTHVFYSAQDNHLSISEILEMLGLNLKTLISKVFDGVDNSVYHQKVSFILF